MKNKDFLKVIKQSFDKYLETDPRSNQKLKILHGTIAKDLKERLGDEYELYSLGFGKGKEISVHGRYMDKKVDIAIKKNGEILAAIGLKFIMRNYSQNSNNYFENMLGETANIKAAGIPYFQIAIIPSKVPYFEKGGNLKYMETITKHNLSKYINLSNDDIEKFIYMPNKTLVFLVDYPDIPDTHLSKIKNNADYIGYYQKNNDFTIIENKTTYDFGDAIIYNNYNKFIEEVISYVKETEKIGQN